MQIKGIRYTAPIFDNSGYGKASRGNIMSLYSLGIPITLNPISFEGSKPDLLENESIVLNSLVNKDIDYNINFIHTTPEFWEKYRKPDVKNVGYTVWETDRLHYSWPRYINDNVDKAIVVCEWNKEVFESSGVTIPIGVVQHGIHMDDFKGIKPYDIDGIDKDEFVFYSVFQWCYDEQTRVLTEDGFKYFKDLVYTDRIATLNPKTEELEYYNPEKLVKFRRKDKMFHLKGSLFDVCVTPDHKMVVKNKNDMFSDWKLIPFNELVSKGKSGQTIIPEKYRAKKNCKWIGKPQSVFKIPQLKDQTYSLRKGSVEEIPMGPFLEFMGWYLSEGSTYKAKRGYITTITQYKLKYRSEIIDCVKKMGFNPIEKNEKDIIFNSRELYYYLKQFGKCNEKFIPTWIKKLSFAQIKILLNSLFKGDGTSYENGDWVKYVTTSKRLSEDVLECLLKVGMSGAISITDPALGTPGKIDGREIKGSLLQYIISVNREQNEPSMSYANFKEIDYDGYVYCATVQNHTMLVERNGKVIFSGNTERKCPLALIKAYWHAFQNDENVALVLKTYRSDYSDPEKQAIRSTINRLKSVMPIKEYPPIYLISHMLSEKEILGLHTRGDCYVSLDRGEGFGLSPFIAGANGTPIIVTGLGGSTEYAKEDNSYLNPYTLTPVFGMPYSPWYSGDQLWAEPDVYAAVKTMRYIYENKSEAKEKGLRLKKYISENFTWEHIGKKLIKELETM